MPVCPARALAPARTLVRPAHRPRLISLLLLLLSSCVVVVAAAAAIVVVVVVVIAAPSITSSAPVTASSSTRRCPAWPWSPTASTPATGARARLCLRSRRAAARFRTRGGASARPHARAREDARPSSCAGLSWTGACQRPPEPVSIDRNLSVSTAACQLPLTDTHLPHLPSQRAPFPVARP